MSETFINLSTVSRLLQPELSKKQPLRVDGTHSPTALALLLLQETVQHEGEPHLLLFANDSEVQEFQQAISFFSPNKNVFELPAFDVGPYSGLYPNRKAIAKRLQWLNAAGHARAGDLFVATAEAICQKTLPFDVFHSASFRVQKSDSIPDGFTDRLNALAYMSTPTVEDVGTYAVRGGIIDIYSPAHERPFRIELFGDIVESIRFFDPQTQRSVEEAKTTDILPAREVLFEFGDLDAAIAAFKEDVDPRGLPREEVLEVLRSMTQRNYFFGIDFLLPIFYKSLASPLEFFNQAPRVWIYQKDELYRAADGFYADKKDEHAEAQSLVIRPDPTRLYEKIDELSWPDPNLRIEVERLSLDHVEAQGLTSLHYKSFSLSEFAKTFQGLNAKAAEQKAFLKQRVESWHSEGYRIGIAAQTVHLAEKLKLLFEKADLSATIIDDRSDLVGHFATDRKESSIPILIECLPESFRLPDEHLLLLREVDFWGKRQTARRTHQDKEFRDRAEALSFGELKPGDLVVHRQHGIGVYEGLNVMSIDNVKAEYLQLRYKEGDKLYLPVYRVAQLQKYSGPSSEALLDKLGGTSWAKTSGKVKSQVRDLAAQLLKLYAKRSQAEKIPFSAPDEAYQQFENAFPYEETEDQLRAINEVLGDMTSAKPMDRLICGDVGFGKTEVALRAAFKAAEDQKQVALIAPTTILTFQHFETFKKRFKDWPLTVAALNRFVSPKEQREVLRKLKAGEVDVLIGTHRLLSKDVEFKDLGLLIVDEEQKFGVAHKEKLRKLREGVDTLAMSATPIPRTLNMSLMGIRDLSLINTPPEDRLPTRTFVSRFDEITVQKAVQSEVQRGGQVFFLHNRVQSIYGRADELRTILPGVRISVAHGQMKEADLEETMMRFFNHEIDMLICTAIIESGMDIPRANTIFIDNAHTFGVSQLYQLRGRVGRSKERAYCYLLVPPNKKLEGDAQERLRILQENTALGSGIRVAQYDLELRGAGDLLGAEQSGHINAVGYEMYMELLDQAVHELRGDTERVTEVEPEINLRIPAFIPDDYIPDIRMRLSYYKALSQITDPYELDQIEEELRDQFGKPPESVLNLMGLMLVRKDCRDLGVRDASAGSQWLTLAFTEQTRLPPQEVIRLTSQQNKKYQITPDQRLKIRMSEITWPRVHDELTFLINLVPGNLKT